MKYKYIIGKLYRCEEDWTWQVSHMRDYDLWMVLSGSGRIETGNEIRAICRGDCFVFPPGTGLRAWHNPETPLQVIAVHFVPEQSEKPAPFGLHRKIPDPDLLYNLISKSVRHADTGNAQKADYWLNTALTELEEFDRSSSGQSRPGYYDDKLLGICSEIKTHPEKNWTIATMAADCGLSSDHFCKIFKAFTGTSPGDYVITVRVEQAQSYLLASSMNINQIADRLGYSSLYFFSRQFKKKIGISPRDYRKSFTQSRNKTASKPKRS